MDSKSLRKLMEDRKLSKQEISELTGVSVRTVEGWLAGRPLSKPAQKILGSKKFLASAIPA